MYMPLSSSFLRTYLRSHSPHVTNLTTHIHTKTPNKQQAKDIESHPTKVMPDGKIYAKIPPLKVKRPTTDMIVL